MKFYVIYTVDSTREAGIRQFQPPNMRQWTITEKDDQAEFFELGFTRHRKYVGEIDRKTFDRLVFDRNMNMEYISTSGSLTEHGWLPAASFTCYDADYTLSAYVTPLPRGEYEYDDRTWDRIVSAMLSVYGYIRLTKSECATNCMD